MKQKIKYILRFLLALALTLAFALAGAFVGKGVDDATVRTVGFVALAMMGAVLLLVIVSPVLAKNYVQKKQASVRATQEHLLARRDEAINNLPRVVRRMVTVRRLITLYNFFILLVAVALSFCIGLGNRGGFAVVPLYLFYGFLGRLLPQVKKPDFSEYTKPEDYPTLHALAHKAAKTVGEDGPVRICLLADCNAGIAKIGKTYSLQLGVMLLSILTEEELYQVLLHEFAHLTKDSNPADKEARLYGFITEREDSQLSAVLNLLFYFADVYYTFEYIVYRMTSSAVIEAIADRALVTHGNPTVAANALAKIGAFTLFDREIDMHIDDHILAPEEPRNNYLETKLDAFRKALPKREAFWREIFKNEIQPRSASHPILRSRLEAIGVTDYALDLPEDSGAYREETGKAFAEIEERVAKSIAENYAEKREEAYLSHLRTVEEWQKSDTPLAPEKSRAVIDALRTLDRKEELEALCNSIIETSDNVFATPHAHMARGVLRLNRYDNGGIEDLYRAMELNYNYVDDALEIIGEYCCLMGLEKELEEYRERAVEKQQTQVDEYNHTATLTARDHLVTDTMPKEMLQSILDYFASIDNGSVDKIYLVRKIVTESFFASVFVVKPKENAKDEDIDDVMDAIFNHLDTRPEDWQFSLFIYDQTTANAVKKVKDSLVYEGKKDIPSAQ